MNTVKCEDCGKEFSVYEKFCPVCCWKYPREERQKAIDKIEAEKAARQKPPKQKKVKTEKIDKPQKPAKKKSPKKISSLKKKKLLVPGCILGVTAVALFVIMSDISTTTSNNITENETEISNEKNNIFATLKESIESRKNTISKTTQDSIPDIEEIFFHNDWEKHTDIPEEFSTFFHNYATKQNKNSKYYAAEIEVKDWGELDNKLSDMLTGYKTAAHTLNINEDKDTWVSTFKGYPFRKDARCKIFFFLDYKNGESWYCDILTVTTDDSGEISSVKKEMGYYNTTDHIVNNLKPATFLDPGAKKSESPINTIKYKEGPEWSVLSSNKKMAICQSSDDTEIIAYLCDDTNDLDNQDKVVVNNVKDIWSKNGISKDFSTWKKSSTDVELEEIRAVYETLPFWNNSEGSKYYVKEIKFTKNKSMAISNYIIEYSSSNECITNVKKVEYTLQGVLPLDTTDYELIREGVFSQKEIKTSVNSKKNENTTKTSLEMEAASIREDKRAEIKEKIEPLVNFVKGIGDVVFSFLLFVVPIFCIAKEIKFKEWWWIEAIVIVIALLIL